MDRRVHGPGAVRIDAQRILRAEFPPQCFDRLDLLVRVEHAALELDLTEAILAHHLPGLTDHGLGIQAFAPFVRAGIVAGAAAARMLVEQIGGERNQIANAAADHLADGLSDRLADDVEARDLDGGERSRVLVQRIFAGNQICLAAIARRCGSSHRSTNSRHRPISRNGSMPRMRDFAASSAASGPSPPYVSLMPVMPSVVFNLHDGAQSIWRMPSVGTAERSVGDGNRMEANFGYPHVRPYCIGQPALHRTRPRNAAILKDSMRVVPLLSPAAGRLRGSRPPQTRLRESMTPLPILSEITGWKPLKKVQYDTMDRVALEALSGAEGQGRRLSRRRSGRKKLRLKSSAWHRRISIWRARWSIC